MSEDFALPWVDIVSPEAVTYPRSARVVVRWHATGAGALSEAAWLDGEPARLGQPIDMLWLQPGQHTLRVRVTDATGRAAERSVTFSVAVSLEGLLEATGRRQVFLDQLDAHVGPDLTPKAHTVLRRDALSRLDDQG